jgi:hypothetical protein
MLVPWQTFYAIVGTAAATLTGLMFVVIALIAQLRARLPSPQSGVRFFNTSNVIHFGAALLVAAILAAPWPSLWEASLLLGLAGQGNGDDGSCGFLPKGGSFLSSFRIILEAVEPFSTKKKERGKQR